jgi:hypothetical protein
MGDKATTPPTPPLTAMLREAGDDSRPRCGAQSEFARQAAQSLRRNAMPQRLRRNLQRVFLKLADGEMCGKTQKIADIPVFGKKIRKKLGSTSTFASRRSAIVVLK